MKKKKEDNPIVNQVLTPEFLKQFKDSGELNSFMENLYARAMEQMLEGELDGHLGYAKQAPEGINSGNSRNGKGSKKVKTTLGEVELEVPRDRNGTFEPVLVPKRSRKAEGVEQIIISLYVRGMSVRDIELQIRAIQYFRVYDFQCYLPDPVPYYRMAEPSLITCLLRSLDGRHCLQSQAERKGD